MRIQKKQRSAASKPKKKTASSLSKKASTANDLNSTSLRTKMPVILIVTGICLLIAVMSFGMYSKFRQANMIATYVSETTKQVSNFEKHYDRANAYNKAITDVSENTLSTENQETLKQYNQIFPENNGIIGVLEINKISLRLPIYHGTSDEVLMQGVGHVERTAFPLNTKGAKSILTGHNGVPGADMLFTRLDEMEKNDTFDVRIGDHVFTYRVKKLKVITPDEADEYASEHNPADQKQEVTLMTCTPYGINTHRLLVIGEFESESKAKPMKPMPVSLGKETIVIFVIIGAGVIALIVIYWLHRKQKKEQLKRGLK